MAKKTNEEISAILKNAIDTSTSFFDTRMSRERTEVTRYYNGDLPKPYHSGDSKYVSRDVYDAVDSMRATILETFSAHQRIVHFKPENQEDAIGHRQATDYCRYVVFRDNPGEDIFYDTLTDGLTARYGVVKVSVEDAQERDERIFENITEAELGVVLAPMKDVAEVEITDQDEETGLWSGVIRTERDRKRIRLESLPPEDFMMSRQATSVEDAEYCIHRSKMTRSDLVKMGIKRRVVNSLKAESYDMTSESEKAGRFEPVETRWQLSGEATSDAEERITVYEVYIRMDVDGRGVSQLWQFLYCDGTILKRQMVRRKPFALFVPLPVSHTWFGDNYAKSVIPTQNARTTLLRQIINHAVLTNNPRWKVLTGTVPTAAELMDNRLGGLVNVRRMDGIAPLEQAPLNPFTFETIRLLDEDKEETTGISKLSQGLNKDAISTQNAQGLVERLISASQQRQKIVARRFAKFLKELYLLIYDSALSEIDRQDIEDVSGRPVTVEPTRWIERKSCSVELSLGYGEMEQEAMKFAELHQFLSSDARMTHHYGPEQRYAVVRKILEKRGIDNVDEIFLPLELAGEPQPSAAEQMQAAQAQAQVELTKAQAQAAILKMQNEQMRLSLEMQKFRAQHGLEVQEFALDVTKFKHDAAMDVLEAKLAQQAPEQRAIFAMDG